MGGCNNAGLVWQNGFQGQQPSPETAASNFETACSGGYKNGCFNLSTLYLKGSGSIAKDVKKAFEYSLKSCELGHSWGCANTSRMYELGDGVEKSEEKAMEYRKRATDLAAGRTVNH